MTEPAPCCELEALSGALALADEALDLAQRLADRLADPGGSLSRHPKGTRPDECPTPPERVPGAHSAEVPEIGGAGALGLRDAAVALSALARLIDVEVRLLVALESAVVSEDVRPEGLAP